MLQKEKAYSLNCGLQNDCVDGIIAVLDVSKVLLFLKNFAVIITFPWLTIMHIQVLSKAIS